MAEQDLSNRPTRTCVQCGCQSPLLEAFHEEKQAGGPVYYCPKCWEKRGWFDEAGKRHLSLIEISVPLALCVVAGGVLITYTILPSQLFVILASFYLLLPVAIAFHEAGHAGAALLFGLRVYSISVGMGKPLVRFSLGQTAVEISNPFRGGFVHFGHPQGQFLRWKHFLTILAGPAVTGTLAAVVWIGTDCVRQMLVGERTVLHLAAVGFLLTNLIGLAVNLWPHEFLTAIGKVMSDGLALWRILGMSEEDFRQVEIAYMMGEVGRCVDRKDQERAKEWCRRGLELQPGHRGLSCLLALALSTGSSADIEEARQLFRKILEDSPIDVIRTVSLTTIAKLNLREFVEKDGRELLAEADRCSQEAFDIEPWDLEIASVRGCVLVFNGAVDQGLAMLQQVFHNEKPEGKTTRTLAHMALAESLRGNKVNADQHLGKLKYLDPDPDTRREIDEWLAKSLQRLKSVQSACSSMESSPIEPCS